MQAIKDILSAVIGNLNHPEVNQKRKLMEEWGAIVGEKIAVKTKPSLANNGTLTIWVAESTLAFELNQKYKNSFLKRAQAVLGEDQIKKIYIRVGQIR